MSHEIWCVLTRLGIGAAAACGVLASLAAVIWGMAWLEDNVKFFARSKEPKGPGLIGWLIIASWAALLCYQIGSGVARRMGWC